MQAEWRRILGRWPELGQNLGVDARVLSVLSDVELGRRLREALAGDQLSVTVAGSPLEAWTLLEEGPWDVVVGDVSGEVGGEELLARVLSADLLSQVVFYSAFVTVPEAVGLMRMGAWSVLLAEDAGVNGLAEAVREAWEERLADIELAREHGIE